MLKAVIFAAVTIVSVAATTGSASAQAAPAGVEKKNYNYSEWTKGRFSEVVTVTGSERWSGRRPRPDRGPSC